MEILKENSNKIMENIKEIGTDQTRHETLNMVEISYFLGENKEKISKLNNLINELSIDGLYTFNLFVKECFNQFLESNTNSLYIFLEQELEQIQEIFINEYFIKK